MDGREITNLNNFSNFLEPLYWLLATLAFRLLRCTRFLPIPKYEVDGTQDTDTRPKVIQLKRLLHVTDREGDVERQGDDSCL